MRAAWYESAGPAREVLAVGEMPVPEPGFGEVRVRIHVSAVNPSDIKSRTGWRPGPLPFPRIVPHQDGAGEIDAIGAGVEGRRVGERVWVYEAQFQRPFGTAAEYVVVPERRAVPLAGGVSFEVGATLGIPALTAHRALFADGPIRDRTIVVTGAGGAVGMRAVQLARWGGAARVIATFRRAEQEAVAREAGAHEVVCADGDALRDRLRDLCGGPNRIDRIVDVDVVAHQHYLAELLVPNGVVSAYASGTPDARLDVPFGPLMRDGIVIRTLLVYVMPEEAKDAAICDVTAALREGVLAPKIQATYPLERIADAHEAQENRPIGKILISLT
jgi:NADPH:quinone reductase-like Zn-dependent oxidoreductase